MIYPGANKRCRNSFFSLLLLFLFIILLSSCSRRSDWVRFRGEGGRGVSSSSISPPLGVRWKIKLQENEELIDSLNPPVVIGDTIYFGSSDGNFYALDVESGYMRWVFRSGAEINSIPAADSRQVYFGSKDGKVYALSRESGLEQWNFQTRSQVNSQVERYGDYVIFVSDADAMYFLSPDGDEQFRINNPGWYNYTFNMTDNVMYFATGPRVSLVGPYDIKRQEFLWYVPYGELDAHWYSFSAVRKNLVYFGTADSGYGTYLGYYAFDRRTGQKVWGQHFEGVFPDKNWGYDHEWEFFLRNTEMLDFMAPTIWKDLVIYTGGDSVARAFDAETGQLRWERYFNMPLSCTSTVAGSRIYFGLVGDEDTPARLICLEARDGRLLWSMELEGSILSSPVIAGKRIIFGTDKNIFYVLEEVF